MGDGSLSQDEIDALLQGADETPSYDTSGSSSGIGGGGDDLSPLDRDALTVFFLVLISYRLPTCLHRIPNSRLVDQNSYNRSLPRVRLDCRYIPCRSRETHHEPSCPSMRADHLRSRAFPIRAFGSFSTRHHSNLHPGRRICLAHALIRFS